MVVVIDAIPELRRDLEGEIWRSIILYSYPWSERVTAERTQNDARSYVKSG